MTNKDIELKVKLLNKREKLRAIDLRRIKRENPNNEYGQSER